MNTSDVSHNELDGIASVGRDLMRPECVLATAAGSIYCSSWRGGVTHIHPDGTQSEYLSDPVDGISLRPNGIALLRDGSFLLAHLGDQEGGVYQLTRSGIATPWLREVDGVEIPPTNFVVEDSTGIFWVTVSTRRIPRSRGYRADCDDGFIVRVDRHGSAIVADGLGYVNEVAVHPSGRWLYANETFARKLVRFPIAPDGALGSKEIVSEFGAGTFPDGLAFDGAGNAWVISIVSNRIIYVSPDGAQHVWLEDSDYHHLEWAESAFLANQMDRPHLDSVKSKVLRNISSIAFSGPSMRTGLLGCLLGTEIKAVQMPNAGHPPTHWHYPY